MVTHRDASKGAWSMFVVLGLMGIGCSGADSDVEPPFELGVVTSPLDIQNVAATNSSWSGSSGAQKTSLLRAATDDDYLEGFTMEENGDDPCKFSALFNDVDTDALDGNELFSECDGSPGDFEFAHMANDFRTTGLAVCLNNNKVKGFALIGRFPECILDPNGTTPTGAACNGRGPRSDAVVERTNCPGSKNGIDSDWESIVECPAGSIVTGVELNHRDGNGDRRIISGARAICHPLLP